MTRMNRTTRVTGDRLAEETTRVLGVRRNASSLSLASTLRRGLLALVLLTALAGCGQLSALTGRSATVDIAYLNHPPVRAVLADVDPMLASYGDRVRVNRYDLDTPEGQDFLKSKGITERTVLAIFVNGSMEFKADDKQVKFFSFPVGRGTQVTAAGDWNLPDFEAALNGATGGKP